MLVRVPGIVLCRAAPTRPRTRRLHVRLLARLGLGAPAGRQRLRRRRLGAGGVELRGGAETSNPRGARSEVFIQITDPQLGMLNMYDDPGDWTAELDMFSSCVSRVLDITPRPRFLFVGGDMQNFWPNEPDPAGRDRNAVKGIADIAALQLGEKQRQAIKDEVKRLKTLPVHYTAGNHDVGDNPDETTLKAYADWWGPHTHVVQEDGMMGSVRYVQLNSQLHWKWADGFRGEPARAAARTRQLADLRRAMEDIDPSTVKLLVALTHIPPFMDDIVEDEGWANWRRTDRTEVLDILTSKRTPLLFVCGHFHTNVELKRTTYGRDNVPIAIRVSSSAGTPMEWDGKPNMTSSEAQAVASKAIGIAFGQSMLGGNGNWSLKEERMQAVPDRAGMRIWRVWDDGRFADRWLTVQELRGLQGPIDAEALLPEPE